MSDWVFELDDLVVDQRRRGVKIRLIPEIRRIFVWVGADVSKDDFHAPWFSQMILRQAKRSEVLNEYLTLNLSRDFLDGYRLAADF